MLRAHLGLGLVSLALMAAGSLGAGCSGDENDGGGAGEPTLYAVEQACEMFAAVFCAKAAECGLVLAQTATQLVCIDCTPATLDLIEGECLRDIEGPKNATELDRCLANASTAACVDVCSDAEVPDCDALDEFETADPEPVVCDEVCASG